VCGRNGDLTKRTELGLTLMYAAMNFRTLKGSSKKAPTPLKRIRMMHETRP